jgi:hypothetical protein
MREANIRYKQLPMTSHANCHWRFASLDSVGCRATRRSLLVEYAEAITVAKS